MQSKTNKYIYKIPQKEYNLFKKIMKEINDQLGTGYVKAACDEIGVKEGTYYKALKNIKSGKRLSKNQLDVLAKHRELVEQAKKKLESIK